MSWTGPRRLLIALAPNAPEDSQLEPVLRFASHRQAVVEGVFVEDLRSYQVVEYPMARFVHAHGPEAPSPDRATMRRAYRATSTLTRERFAARLGSAAASWSFRTRECTSLTDAFADATEGDLVVVPLARGGRNLAQVRELIEAVMTRIPASLLVLNESARADRSVLVVFDGDRNDLAAAASLAQAFGCLLSVFEITDLPGGDAAGRQAAIEALGPDVETTRFSANDPKAIEAAILARMPGTLTVDRAGPVARTLDLGGLLERASISLFVRN